MKISELRIREFSDLHLGHNKTPTSHMLKVLSTLLPDNEKTGELDIIIMAGDMFDRDLQLYQDEVYEIKCWIASFLKMCHKRDIMVRILEGTPRHDWTQSKLFLQINEMLEIGANVGYYGTVDIEYIPEFGAHFLYIPDEFKPTTLETQTIVSKLMVAKGLEKVDFTIMHGAFPHQLPKSAHARAQLHNPNFYLSITRYFIFIGHIHQYSQYERILSAGSTDRICHNDEKRKGMIEVIARLNGEHDIRFIENKQANIFITLDFTGDDEATCTAKLNAVIKKHGTKFNLRVLAKVNDPVYRIIDAYISKYSLIDWSFKRVEEKKPDRIVSVSDLFKHVSLNKENIVDLLLEKVSQLHPELYEHSKTMLEVTVHESS